MSTTTTSKSNKLKARDFINIGIFSIIFVALLFASVTATSISVVAFPFAVTICALIAAPVYMLMHAKVSKFGGILLFGAIYAFLMLLTGAGAPIAILIAIGAIIAEGLASIGKYKSFLMNALGYVVIMVASTIGQYVPMLMMKDYYLELAESNSVEGDFMVDLMNFISGPVVIIATVATAITAILGVVIARAMFKKHFIKAGIVKEHI